MRLKPAIIVLSITLFSAGSAYAATDITGDIYGSVFQNMSMGDGGFPYGVSIDDISEESEDCDNTKQICYIKGFSWSDVVGWTYWDGATLQTELGGAGNFPDEYIAKAAYNGNIGGYIWGEKFGWISLSRCDGLGNAACAAEPYCEWTGGNRCEVSKTNRVPEVTSQSESEWGVYIDFCPQKTSQAACENIADSSDTYCNWDLDENTCVFDKTNNPNGQPLGGYAWSQYLGWVKFGPKGSDTGFTGAFTNWFPDMTPPEFKAVVTTPGSYVWIPNESPVGAITWNEFVDEDESFVDLLRSSITVSAVDNGPGGDFDSCPDPGTFVISLGETGEGNIHITQIGNFVASFPPYGYCKYTMGGVLYNQTGFAHYFGPEGISQATSDGVDTTNPATAAPNTYANEGITIYIRAGDLVPNTIGLSAPGNDVIADGNNTIGITFSPRDVAGNPIVSVKGALDGTPIPGDPSNWVRNVELLYDFDGSPYAFDSVSFLRNIIYPVPVAIGIEAQTYSYLENLWYPFGGAASMEPIGSSYLLDVTGFAPSTVSDNNLTLAQIDFNTNDLELPAISPTQGPWPASSVPIALNNSTSPSVLPLNYLFRPALTVTDGDLNSDFLAINQGAEATFEFSNNSVYSLSEFSLDNILDFHDEGSGSELLEVEDINLITLSDLAGRTDPNGPGSRYGLIYSLSNAADAGFNQFHSNSENFHDPVYTLENDADAVGEYTVSGNAFVAPDDPCIAEDTCTPVDIDRSDLLSSSLTPGASDSFTFAFTPTRYIGGSSSGQISFDIDQYLSYYFSHYNPPFLQHAVYHADPWIDDVLVKSIGLDTSGIVGGQQVYESGGGRDLATITTTSSADLRREIRRNVAVLTRNMTACQPATSIDSLDMTAKDCVSIDPQNKTVVAYYTGDAVITLGDGINDIQIPDGYKYTMIFNEVDLNLASNILYPDGGSPNTSFGIIVIQSSDGIGGTVYLSPTPTNMVGLLYAEGSLLSSPDAGVSLYYTSGGPDPSTLTNQLFWQGSIASRNTIGGTTGNIIPENADCTRWDNVITACSQGYDLDFTRRFTTLKESATGDQYSPVGTKFSGGGSCTEGPVNCVLGPLPTTISLVAGVGGNVISPASKSLDAFFIERDNRPVPPGFSSKGGLTSTQEIR